MNALRFSFYFISVLWLASCHKKENSSLELSIHYPKVQISLDPHHMEDAYSMMINSQLYRGLLRFNSSGDVMPDLAESWKESADKKNYRFKLQDLRFSNGEPILAKNVQFSFARIFLLRAGMSADLGYLEGAQKFQKTKNISDLGVRIISDKEVEFKLSYPSSLFLKHIAVADCAILPISDLSKIESLPDIFSGPYKVKRKTEHEFELIKWRSDKLESNASPRKITFFGNSDDPVTLAKAGKTDSLDRDFVDSLQTQRLKKEGWGQSPTELTGETFVILNPKFIPKEIRKYLFQQIDPENLAKVLGEPRLTSAHGLIPAGFPGELTSFDTKSLKNSITNYRGKQLAFKLDYDPSSEIERRIAEYLKEKWSSPHLNVNLNPMNKSEKLRRMFSTESEAVLGRKGIDYPDGFSVLSYFIGNYESNYFHISDNHIDKLISETIKEFDSEKRAQLYRNIQLKILAHHTVVPLLFGSQASGLWSSKVKSVPSHPMGYHTMHFETIEMRTE